MFKMVATTSRVSLTFKKSEHRRTWAMSFKGLQSVHVHVAWQCKTCAIEVAVGHSFFFVLGVPK